MKISKFEDIDSWKEARQLVKEIYEHFCTCKDFGIRDQIQRAAVSVMSNIAEGFDRGSNKEFIQFLIISRASLSEVRSLSYAALDIGHIDQITFEKISRRCLNLSNLLNGLLRYLRNSHRTN